MRFRKWIHRNPVGAVAAFVVIVAMLGTSTAGVFSAAVCAAFLYFQPGISYDKS